MLMLKEFKTKEGLVDSYGELINPKEEKTYYVLYESEKIIESYISTLFINTLNGYYDEAYFSYKDYFIILTKTQYDNLFKGKIKNA